MKTTVEREVTADSVDRCPGCGIVLDEMRQLRVREQRHEAESERTCQWGNRDYDADEPRDLAPCMATATHTSCQTWPRYVCAEHKCKPLAVTPGAHPDVEGSALEAWRAFEDFMGYEPSTEAIEANRVRGDIISAALHREQGQGKRIAELEWERDEALRQAANWQRAASPKTINTLCTALGDRKGEG